MNLPTAPEPATHTLGDTPTTIDRMAAAAHVAVLFDHPRDVDPDRNPFARGVVTALLRTHDLPPHLAGSLTAAIRGHVLRTHLHSDAAKVAPLFTHPDQVDPAEDAYARGVVAALIEDHGLPPGDEATIAALIREHVTPHDS